MIGSGFHFLMVGGEERCCMMRIGVVVLFAVLGAEGVVGIRRAERLSRGRSNMLSRGL
jgi:hypothetical protein